MNEKQFLLPISVRDALLNYLALRPYNEVVQGVNALSTLVEAPSPEVHPVVEPTPAPDSAQGNP